MRILSILAALIVAVIVLAFTIERDATMAYLRGDSATETTDQPAAPSTAAQAAQPAAPAMRVVALHSTARDVDSAVVLRGQTQAWREVEVKAETSSTVMSEPLPKGTFVDAGQLLCKLSPGTRGATLAEARARLSEATAAKATAESRVPEAQSRVAEAQAKLDETLINQNAAAKLSEGGFAAETRVKSADATVIQLDPIKLVAFVPETDVSRVHVGAMAGGRLAAGGDDVRGQVTFLSRAADPVTRTFRVEIEIPNSDLTLRDGQTVEILIATDGAPAHLLPQSALTLNDEGTLGLRTLGPDSVVQFQPVKILRDTPDGIWLTGLPDAVDVIVVGQEYVTAGVTVEATFREAAE